MGLEVVMSWFMFRRLRSANPLKRLAAVENLAGFPDPRAIDALVGALDDSSGPVAKAAQEALVGIGDDAVETLRRALKSDSADLRFHAATALRRINPGWVKEGGGAAELALALASAMKSEHWTRRRDAAIELGEIGDPHGAAALASALTDDNRDVSKAACQALGRIEIRIPDDSQAVLFEQPTPLPFLPLDAIPALASAVGRSSMHYDVATAARDALIRMGAAAVEPLICCMRDQEGSTALRMGAAETLGGIADSRVSGALMDALRDPSASVRMAAAKALQQKADPRTWDVLTAALADAHPDVRMASVEALQAIRPGRPPAEALPTLLAALRDKDRWVRERAARYLGGTQEPRALEALAAALKDVEREVCRAARDALISSGAASTEFLMPVLNDDNPQARTAAVQVLASSGAKSVAAALANALSDRDIEVRTAAAEGLCRVGGPDSVGALLTALGDSWRVVQKVAARGLGEFGDERVLGALLREARHSEAATECVGALASVLRRVAGRAFLEDLQAAAQLHATLSVFFDNESAATPYGEWEERKVDCSTVREIARQELARRGFL